MLLCKPLKTHTKGEDIFQVIESFFEEHDISWQNCSRICTDGAAAMVGKYSGVVSRMKNKNSGIVHIHCFLHRHALAIKRMPPDLNEVIDDVTKTANFIKARPLNSRIFSLLCEDMGSTHKALILHTAVRWLSKGKVLVRFYELHEEVYEFLSNLQHDLASKLKDKISIQRLAYLSDIFAHLNETNISLQGNKVTYFKAQSKIIAFQRKLKLWNDCILEGKYECFEHLCEYLLANQLSLHTDIKVSISQHLFMMVELSGKYFISNTENFLRIQDPFLDSHNTQELSLRERENSL